MIKPLQRPVLNAPAFSYFHRVAASFSLNSLSCLRTFSIALLAAAGLAGVFAGPQLLGWIVSRLHAALDTSFWSEGFIASGWWLLTFAASLCWSVLGTPSHLPMG